MPVVWPPYARERVRPPVRSPVRPLFSHVPVVPQGIKRTHTMYTVMLTPDSMTTHPNGVPTP